MTRITIIIVMGLLGLAGAANADRDKARALTERGTKTYNLGEYAAAADAFRAAYDEYPDPTLLYDLAQCERQLSHKPKAITLYRSYLREAPHAANADDVRRLIAALEQDVLREERARNRLDETPTAPAGQANTSAVAAPPAGSRVSHRRWWTNPTGWTLVGIGVAVGAGGGALLGVSANTEDSAAIAATLQDARARMDQASRLRAAGLALVGVGAGAAVAGVLVLAIMPSRWRAHAALVPYRNGAMFAVGGSL